jgi:ABC-type branched-subunit amino acid transport system ATPase component
VTGLEVVDLSVAYGGNTVVHDVSLAAPKGHVTGLIGPNGAGKTTMFNACCGIARPKSGQVCFLGRDVTRASPAKRAQLGLGRTFQRVELCDTMTVAENVMVGCEARDAGTNAIRQLFPGPSRSRQVQAAVADALHACGLAELADRQLWSLSTGQRRLVELARVLAAGFEMLLLDEPSSGLDDLETERFGATVTAAVADRGLGVLLVEHDMNLVMSVCEYIYVLDFGQMIFEGTPSETVDSDIVKRAYLGDEVGAA